MFHLTPQEKTALAAFLTVGLLGSAVSFGLTRNFRPLRWAAAATQKAKPSRPDLNTSSAKELEKIPGIGAKTAQKIVDYRAQHGPFISVEGLRRIKGITKINLQKIRKYYAEVPAP